jgi:hypothetical protein
MVGPPGPTTHLQQHGRAKAHTVLQSAQDVGVSAAQRPQPVLALHGLHPPDVQGLDRPLSTDLARAKQLKDGVYTPDLGHSIN